MSLKNFVKNNSDEISDEPSNELSDEPSDNEPNLPIKIVNAPKEKTLRSIKMNNDDTSNLKNEQIIIQSGKGEKTWETYFREFKYYKEKFGKIALLFQIGEFYEFYGVDNDIEEIGNMKEIFKVLGIVLTKVGIKHNPDIRENDRKNNPLKGGFPLNAYHDHVQTLIEHGFTVIEISETGNSVDLYDANGKNKENKKERALIRIVTPSTFIDEIDSTGQASYALSIFITNYTRENKKEEIRIKGWKECTYSIGMTAIDWSTNGNDSVVYEAHDKKCDNTYAMNEVYRFIHGFNPKEIIVNYKSSFKFEEEDPSKQDATLSEESFQDFLKKELELQRFSIAKIGMASKVETDLNYQIGVLERVYPKTGMLPVVDYLQLDSKIHAMTSFVQLLQFAYERDARVLHSLEKPGLWFSENHLMLSNNAIYQLHLMKQSSVEDKSEPGLIDILDRTKTPMGSRLLRYDILNPIVNEKELNTRYNIIEILGKCVNENVSEKGIIFDSVRKYLSHISDIEKMYRHIELGILRPNMLVKLHYAHIEMIKMIDWMKSQDNLNNFWNLMTLNDKTIKSLKKFVKKSNSLFDLEKMGYCSQINKVDESFFKKGTYNEIDSLQDQIDSSKDSLETFTNVLSNLIDPKSKTPAISIKKLASNSKTKKETFGLNCSKARFRLIDHYLNVLQSFPKNAKKNIFKYANSQTFNKFLKRNEDEKDDNSLTATLNQSNRTATLLNDREIQFLESICEIKREKLKSNVEFQSHYINDSKDIVGDLHIKMNQTMRDTYRDLLISITEEYIPQFHLMSKFISRIDVYSNHSCNAREFRYTRPTIKRYADNESDDDEDNKNHKNDKNDQDTNNEESGENEEEKSFINATNVRHPIIEKILTRTTYTPNNVTIGCKGINGILLFGINNIGKTSYLRSVGLTVLMAQMGSFVPAEEFTYYPFHHILTRLSGSDNMFKGQGQYQVEISELRDISFRCNNRSLVLADELCHGTEQVSANSIVTGGISYLSKRTNFILATHLHDIPNQPELQKINNVKCYHLEMTRDPVTGKITYNRKLQLGPGESNYGIEVARSNGLPDEILLIAEKVRKRYLEEEETIISQKRSRYSGIYMKHCFNCGKSSEETHHVIEQYKADEEGYIEHFHKNHKANTVPLCKKCHAKVTRGKLSILPPVITSEGIEFPIIKLEK